MGNGEVALHAPIDKLSFYYEVKEIQSDLSQLSWEAAVNKEVAIGPSTVPRAPREGVIEDLPRSVENRLEYRHIGDGAKAFMNQLLIEEVMKLVKETLDDILDTLYHNA